MTSQQQADDALARWQALRNEGLTPIERMERLMADFFKPPLALDIRYEDQLKAVTAEMMEPANA